MLSDRGLLSYTSFALKEKFFFNEKRIIGAGSIPIAIGMTRHLCQRYFREIGQDRIKFYLFINYAA